MISAVVLTHNEEKNIAKCIDSLRFCEEIIVIDDFSTDKTISLAKKLGAQVYERDKNDNFSAQRNFGLEKAKGEWVLFVDADEQVPLGLAHEIQSEIISIDSAKGYYIKREDILWDKKLKYGEVGNMWLLRLARKDAGRWSGAVHEVWKIKGKTEKLKNPIVHYPHPVITEFLSDINYYTTLRAKELHSQGKKSSFIAIVLYPLAKFIANYIVKLGFLDGVSGIVNATLMSFHSFLVRGKLWQLWHKS